jgi:hypothetical protein
VTSPGQIEATVENAGIGHAWPSGAAHDRRAWLEVVAYAKGAVIFESGVFADGEAARADGAAIFLRETLFDANGREVPFLWQAARVESDVLAAPGVAGAAPAQTAVARFQVASDVDRVTMRVRATPIGLEIVDALIGSGDLDPSYRGQIPAYALASTTLEWTRERGDACLP